MSKRIQITFRDEDLPLYEAMREYLTEDERTASQWIRKLIRSELARRNFSPKDSKE